MTAVKLAPEFEAYVNAQVENGAAASAEDYVNDILRAQRDEDYGVDEEFWAKLQAGIDDIEAGRFMSVEDAFANVREELGLRKSAAK
jgi:antitoxin ParD1/3/4